MVQRKSRTLSTVFSIALSLAVAGSVAACGAAESPAEDAADRTEVTPRSTTTATTLATTTTAASTTTMAGLAAVDTDGNGSVTATGSALPRPEWLSRRPVPTTPEGIGIVVETPPELQDRRFATLDLLAPPASDTFAATSVPLEGEALRRSSWNEDCPVPPEDLSYLTVSFWGFDGLTHTGELIVHRSVADDIVAVFEKLFDAKFPIEEMRIAHKGDLYGLPTGDTNNTTAYVCRLKAGSRSSFSEHAKGLAIDINPFINPYIKGERVLPEQAGFYLDRSLARPGMIVRGDVVTQAFADIGWTWGGDWNSLKDYQHFSASGQ